METLIQAMVALTSACMSLDSRSQKRMESPQPLPYAVMGELSWVRLVMMESWSEHMKRVDRMGSLMVKSLRRRQVMMMDMLKDFMTMALDLLSTCRVMTADTISLLLQTLTMILVMLMRTTMLSLKCIIADIEKDMKKHISALMEIPADPEGISNLLIIFQWRSQYQDFISLLSIDVDLQYHTATLTAVDLFHFQFVKVVHQPIPLYVVLLVVIKILMKIKSVMMATLLTLMAAHPHVNMNPDGL